MQNVRKSGSLRNFVIYGVSATPNLLIVYGRDRVLLGPLNEHLHAH